MTEESWRRELKKLGRERKAAALKEKITRNAATVKKEKKEKAAADIDFATAVAPVTPLKSSAKIMRPKIRRAHSVSTEERDLPQKFFIANVENTARGLEPSAEYSRGGQGKKDLRRLSRGAFAIVLTIDLHGLTQDAAQEALNKFITSLKTRGVAGKIIHGRGLNAKTGVPTLKILVRRWLMQHPEVLAYVAAPGSGDGAVLVLVKRRKDYSFSLKYQ